jgi:TDG/mug DNA glycosylase family protein
VIRERIVRYRPRLVCFNGQRAAHDFLAHDIIRDGLQPERLGSTLVFVAPSTSNATRGCWSLQPWQELAERVSASRAAS